MKINYSILQKKIKIKFRDKKLLIKSLTHKSFDKSNNNEKIEFLGDRVLGLIIAKKLLEIYPNEKEGILDKKFASLVNKKTCLQIAKNINLEKYILTFNPKNKKVKIEDKIIADGCEALIGCIYLDKGFSVVENFILDQWKKKLKRVLLHKLMLRLNYKNFHSKNIKNFQFIKLFLIQVQDINPF
jgi:ribonuclease-3